MSDSRRPHGLQPTRLLRPWALPGKSTGVGCHCLLRYDPMHSPKPAAAAAAKSLQSCPPLCNPIDGSPPGSSVPGILQARTLDWVAISFSQTHRTVQSPSPKRTEIKLGGFTNQNVSILVHQLHRCAPWTEDVNSHKKLLKTGKENLYMVGPSFPQN